MTTLQPSVEGFFAWESPHTGNPILVSFIIDELLINNVLIIVFFNHPNQLIVFSEY